MAEREGLMRQLQQAQAARHAPHDDTMDLLNGSPLAKSGTTPAQIRLAKSRITPLLIPGTLLVNAGHSASSEQLAELQQQLAQSLAKEQHLQQVLGQLEQQRDQLLTVIDDLSTQNQAAASAGAAADEASRAMQELQAQLADKEQQLQEAVQVSTF